MEPKIFSTKEELGQQAAAWCAGVINDVIRFKGHARLILATGASQFEFLDALIKLPVLWDKVECFHLDEYVGLSDTHPASFRNYLQKRVWDKVKMMRVHKLNPDDIAGYADQLMRDDIDLACIGIGENGHIAFNDPPVANFNDPNWVKVVDLDEACRNQQVGEGWFPDLNSTPAQAATLTIPAILRCKALSVVVPDQRKATAVKAALQGPVSTSCPASVLRNHGNTVLWLDMEAASLLDGANPKFTTAMTLSFPGLVDLQVNGYTGVDFSNLSLTEKSCRGAFRNILRSGNIMFLPTIITSSVDVYEHVLPIISKVMAEDEFKQHVPGIHLEGPFLSPVDGFRGVHQKEFIVQSSIPFFQRLQQLAEYKVKLLTIAAEVDGSAELCAYASAQGIVVSLGHQSASPEQVSKLAKAGAKMLTHLGNGIRQMAHRHQNPILVGLSETQLKVAMITDGFHLPRHVIKVMMSTRPIDDLIMVSDMAPLVGLTPGDYCFSGGDVTLDANGRLCTKEDANVLAGSGCTLLQSVNFLYQANLATVEYIEKMAFINPLMMLGIDAGAVRRMKSVLRLEYGMFKVQE